MNWILWPFRALWRFVTAILELAGRLIAAIVGIVFIIVGAFLIFSVIVAPIGIALLILGILLLVRSLY